MCCVLVLCVVHIGGCACVGFGVGSSGYTVRKEVTGVCKV